MAKNKEKFYDYDGFVEKFKPKKTTDDCYTPPEVYDIVLKHVREKYNIADDVPIVRPFYPGGDYEHYDYPEGCVVVENPPFSIFAIPSTIPLLCRIHFLSFPERHHRTHMLHPSLRVRTHVPYIIYILRVYSTLPYSLY